MTGRYLYRLDGAGRLILPLEFRREVGVPFYLMLDRTGRLLLCPPDDPMEGAAAVWFVDRITKHEGRFSIPQYLREAVGLRKGEEVVVSGLGDRMEVARYRSAVPCPCCRQPLPYGCSLPGEARIAARNGGHTALSGPGPETDEDRSEPSGWARRAAWDLEEERARA